MICPPDGMVDVIYIDPPYNTGNNDFIYNDSFLDSEDGFKHTKWLNFIEKRLKIAKKLLKDDGIIFISIDDNEQAQLKILSDTIFGSNNFIQMFLWNKNSGGTSLSKFTRTDYEYILCYAKNINEIKYEFLGKFSEGMGDSSLINQPNRYSTLNFPSNTIKFTSKKDGEIKATDFGDLELHNDLIISNSFNANDVSISCKWKWSQDKLDDELKKGTIIISKTSDLRLRYIKDNKGAVIKPTKSIQTRDGVGFNVSGSSDLKNILGETSFSFPKPASLIKYLINMCLYWNLEGTVLDFFAGSGTTAQAVLELNKEDGGNRKFIICTNNEGNIMTDVCYPRIKTVVTGIRNDDSKYSDGINTNVRYLKVGFIEDEASKDQAKLNLVDHCDSLLCLLEETFDKVISNIHYNIYSNESKLTAIYSDYFDEKPFNDLIVKIYENQKSTNVVYYFSLDNNVDESIEKLVLQKIPNALVKPIPSKIYEIYKKIVENIKRDY